MVQPLLVPASFRPTPLRHAAAARAGFRCVELWAPDAGAGSDA
jgi:hypothetical protein